MKNPNPLLHPNPGKPHTVGCVDHGTAFSGGQGTQSKHKKSPSLCVSPSPCRVSAQTAKEPCLWKHPLNLDLLSGATQGCPVISFL